ncbi:carboxypeptidase-like regulatory domain-containing protein [Bythopirellula polymerisocia]|uniref:Carboxypeptidase regulatory-like domain-containing protein n=1 Tax=Bythopirellula polymerisocia TaxID=2528003 RepID=A0A5C6CJM4_9BACT|nr:carboxypeptidase-like regulatory domain-containing protein [Bythopirellula polymerisocia]TWU23684.1 hypothetical protein Pla144_38590 [Bythopirellula polymerisocia]
MKTKSIRVLSVALWALSVVLSPCASAAEATAVRTLDISLQNGGVLSGQVADAAGNGRKGVPVSVIESGKEIGRSTTDEAGKFQIAGLSGGVVTIAAADTQGNCRLWSPGTAPPASQKGVLVVSQDQVACGQDCGSCVGCGSGVCGSRHGGGLFGMMLDHPLLTAGIIGAAIAIPLALDDDDDPPASP